MTWIANKQRSLIKILDNLPKIYLALNTGNLNWEFNLLREHFLVVHRNPKYDVYPFTIQYGANEHNGMFENLLIILRSFKDSKCIVEHKGKVKILNYVTEQYEELG